MIGARSLISIKVMTLNWKKLEKTRTNGRYTSNTAKLFPDFWLIRLALRFRVIHVFLRFILFFGQEEVKSPMSVSPSISSLSYQNVTGENFNTRIIDLYILTLHFKWWNKSWRLKSCPHFFTNSVFPCRTIRFNTSPFGSWVLQSWPSYSREICTRKLGPTDLVFLQCLQASYNREGWWSDDPRVWPNDPGVWANNPGVWANDPRVWCQDWDVIKRTRSWYYEVVDEQKALQVDIAGTFISSWEG